VISPALGRSAGPRHHPRAPDITPRRGIYGFTDLDGSQPDAWRYVVEVQDTGKPADVTGYR
jgi:hypothetical protein